MPKAIRKINNHQILKAHLGYHGTEGLKDAGENVIKVGKIASARQAVTDGDTINISLPTRPQEGETGVDGNLSIRMLGIDTPEMGFFYPDGDGYHKLNEKNWRDKWRDFLSDPIKRLKDEYDTEYSKGLSGYIQEKTSDGNPAQNHHHYAELAEDELENLILEDIKEYEEFEKLIKASNGYTDNQLMRSGIYEFYIQFAYEFMDRYGRILCFINRNQPDEEIPSPRPFDYNARMLFSGLASPYFIWPNINPFRARGSILGAVFHPGEAANVADADWKLRQARRAVRQVRAAKQGLYAEDDPGPLCLEPFELRFLAGKRKPGRWVIDMSKDDDILIHPENYYTIPHPEDRLFISQEHVSYFVEKGWKLQDPPPGYTFQEQVLEPEEREKPYRYINKNPLRGANTHTESKTIYAAWSDGETEWAAAAAECGTVFLVDKHGEVYSHDVPHASGIDFYDIYGFISDESVELVVVGTYGSVFRIKAKTWGDLKEDDWERLETDTELWLEAVWGWSADKFFVAGDDGLVMQYQDGKWRTIITGVINRLYSISGSSDEGDDLAYVVGSFGTILRIHKNRALRIRIRKEYQKDLNGIQRMPINEESSDRYVICGRGGVLLLMEGGRITKIESDTTETLMALDVDESGKVVIVGYRGTWLSYDAMKDGDQAILHEGKLGLNSYMEGVVYNGEGRFLAVGWYGRIMRRKLDDDYWETLQTGRAETIHSIAIHGDRIIGTGDTGSIRVIELGDDRAEESNIFAPPLHINVSIVINNQIVVAGEDGYMARIDSDENNALKKLSCNPENAIRAHTVFDNKHYFACQEGLFSLKPNGGRFDCQYDLFKDAFEGEMSSSKIVGIAIQKSTDTVLFACDDRGNLHRIYQDGDSYSRKVQDQGVQSLFGRDGKVYWIAGNRLIELDATGSHRISGRLSMYFPVIGERAGVGIQDSLERIFIGGDAGTVLCFTAVDEEPMVIFSGAYRRVTALAANEKYLVVGTEGGRLQIMEYHDGNQMPELIHTSSISGPTYYAVARMEEDKFAFCGQESITRILTPPKLQSQRYAPFRGDLLVGIPIQDFVLFAGVENAVRVDTERGVRIHYRMPGHTITSLYEYRGAVYLGTAGGKILSLGLEQFDENSGEREPEPVNEDLGGIPIQLSVENGIMRIVLDNGLVYIERLSNLSTPQIPDVDLSAQLPDKLTAPSTTSGGNDDFYVAGNDSYLSRIKDKEPELIQPPEEIETVTLHGFTGPELYWYGGTTGDFWLRAKDQWHKVSTGIGNQLHGIAASEENMIVVADYGGIRFGNKALIDEINAAVNKSEE